jgi:riboflavin biosynthesis pyrimidine reductase
MGVPQCSEEGRDKLKKQLLSEENEKLKKALKIAIEVDPTLITHLEKCNLGLDLSKYKDKEIIEHKDFVAPREKDANYYFAIYDSKGTIGYQANTKHTTAWANDGTKVISQFIEVLSDQVSNEYLHYLQDLKVSYIFAGKDKVDIRTSLVKLKKLFGIDKMVLQGGPTIDGAFISDDLIDGISIIICPCTAEGGQTLFTPSKYVEFKLIEFRELSNSNMWLHYIKKK